MADPASLGPIFVCFRCKPSSEGRAHGSTGHQMIAPTGISWANNQHPAGAEGILIQELRPPLELRVGGNNGTGERSSRRAYPFATLDYCKRTLSFEILGHTFWGKDEHLAGKLDGDRREARAYHAFGQRLVPDLVFKIIVEVLRIVLAIYERHFGPQ